MRINSGVTSGVGAARPKQGVAVANPSSRAAEVGEAKDVVSVSSAAKLATEIRVSLDKVPSVRASKIEAIQSQFDSDTYHPDGEAVVDGLLREHMQHSGL